MPKIRAGNVALNYGQQGSGQPLILIPYLAADHACYAFQVEAYSQYFTCICLDLRGTGESDKPAGTYTTETLGDDVAALMEAIGLHSAHISGLSLGGAAGMWLAAKYPQRVRSLSLHSGWHQTDAYIQTVVRSWQVLAQAQSNMHDTIIQGILPWCLTPDLYAQKPDYIATIADFVRSRPRQPVDAFLQQTGAVLSHDIAPRLDAIRAPTQITFGRHDAITSTRFAEPLQRGIRGAELHIFEDCSHAPLYENVPAFNETTLAFLRKHSS
jgi:pimeloyl-ACP methyl ester carboxylesterase